MKKRKKFSIPLPAVIVVISLLLLDYASLDDITTNQQSSYLTEYLTLLMSVPVFIYFGYKLIKKFS